MSFDTALISSVRAYVLFSLFSFTQTQIIYFYMKNWNISIYGFSGIWWQLEKLGICFHIGSIAALIYVMLGMFLFVKSSFILRGLKSRLSSMSAIEFCLLPDNISDCIIVLL